MGCINTICGGNCVTGLYNWSRVVLVAKKGQHSCFEVKSPSQEGEEIRAYIHLCKLLVRNDFREFEMSFFYYA